MALMKPLAALNDRWHSTGHYALANIFKGKGLNPKDTREKLTQEQVNKIDDYRFDKRTTAEILAFRPLPQIANTFNRIKARIEEAFENNDNLRKQPDLKKPTLDFIDTLEFGIVDRPDRKGQYVTAFTTNATFDPKVFDYKKLPLVLNILNTELGVREFMDDNMGVMTYGKKAFLTAGQLVLNFTEVNGKNILELVPDQEGEELERFMSKGNGSITFSNGNINANNIFLFDQPVCPEDSIMTSGQTNLNPILKRLSAGNDGITSNFTYTPRGSVVPAANKYPEGKDPHDISTIVSMLDQSTPGYILQRLAQAIDLGGVFVFKDSDKPTLLVDPSALPEGVNQYDFIDDLRRRLDTTNFVEVSEADAGDLLLRDEIKTST